MPSCEKCISGGTKRIADGIFEMRISAPEIAKAARPGQFIHIKCGEERLLRRPISICDVGNGVLRIVFEVKGEGTKWLLDRDMGDSLDVIGPLGNGFEIPRGRALLVGGGIGTAPLLFTSRRCEGGCDAVLGFKSADNVFCIPDLFRTCDDVGIATEDGSAGFKGCVTGPMELRLARGGYDCVLACGPWPMLKAVAELCEKNDIACQTSLEARMGCGVGACLVCACGVRIGKERKMVRVCADGPVFNGREVIW